MTLDKMIKALQPVWEDLGSDKVSIDTACWNLPHISTETREKIIAALRAGWAMRNCFNPIDDEDGRLWVSDINHSALSVAGLAWDAAMEEE